MGKKLVLFSSKEAVTVTGQDYSMPVRVGGQDSNGTETLLVFFSIHAVDEPSHIKDNQNTSLCKDHYSVNIICDKLKLKPSFLQILEFDMAFALYYPEHLLLTGYSKQCSAKSALLLLTWIPPI